MDVVYMLVVHNVAAIAAARNVSSGVCTRSSSASRESGCEYCDDAYLFAFTFGVYVDIT